MEFGISRQGGKGSHYRKAEEEGSGTPVVLLRIKGDKHGGMQKLKADSWTYITEVINDLGLFSSEEEAQEVIGTIQVAELGNGSV